MGPKWAHRVLQGAQVGPYIPFIIYKVKIGINMETGPYSAPMVVHRALEWAHRALEGAHRAL